MRALIKSEYIKGKRSFGRKSLFVFPLVVTLMAIFLMGGKFTQIGALNWWYMMLLPATLAIVSVHMITAEKKNNFFNINILPCPKIKVWKAKIWTGVSYILLANVFLFITTSFSGIVFGTQYSFLDGVLVAFVLTITICWQIPLGMFLTTKFNASVAFAFIIGANFICCGQDIAGGKAWFIPFAIPARLMAAMIGINPNGVPMEETSPLWNTNVILPGILITILLFITSFFITSKWFERKED